MENVGAVTFPDHYLFRDPPTYAQRLSRGEVVLHELAHMWFGDLVTMRWWDDLWLNETFATYLSYRCLADATRFTDAWQVFNGDMRPAAHRQDQLVTTTPWPRSWSTRTRQWATSTPSPTRRAPPSSSSSWRPSVTRRSGQACAPTSSVMPGATPRSRDFLGALGEAAGEPLDEWARLWLQAASLNTIGVRWASEAAAGHAPRGAPGSPARASHAATARHDRWRW